MKCWCCSKDCTTTLTLELDGDSGFLAFCDDCRTPAVQNFVAMQDQFKELLEEGLSRDQANRFMICLIRGGN